MLRQKLVQKDDNNSGKDDTKGNEPSADAEVLADFRKGATSLFEASDGWTNGNPLTAAGQRTILLSTTAC